MNPNEILEQLKARFSALPPRARVLLGVAVVLIAGAAVLMSNAEQVTTDAYLFTGLDPQDAGEIVSKLKEQRVPFSIEGNGGAIMVPQSRVHELRLSLAQAGLPKGGGTGFEIFDKPTYGQSDFVQQKNYLRALQGELERTISALGAVQKARVHLVLPEKRLFREAGDGPQASVVVKVRQGRALSEGQAAGIVHLVASSVAGLSPDRVTLLDDTGRMLSAANGRGLSSEDLDYKRKIELALEEKVRGILGGHRASVQISAELDFTKIERVEESFDPEKRVVRSEQASDERQTQGKSGNGASGVPGVKSNLPGVTATEQASSMPAGSSSESQRHAETRNYEVSKVTSRTVLAPVRIQRITAAVLIDGKLEPAETEAYTQVVKQAIGFDEKRGDQLAMQAMPFKAIDEEPAAEELPKAVVLLRDNAKPVATLLVGLAAALGFLILVSRASRASKDVPAGLIAGGAPRTVREVEAMMASPEAVAAGPSPQGLKGAVMQDNAKAASVVRGWLNEAKDQ